MFCYIYGDYFELYVPGKLASMLEGKMQPLGPVTQAVLVATATLMIIPSVMVCLSLVLGPTLSRLANVVLGAAYSIIMLLVISGGAWRFYMLLGVVEIALTSMIVWYAWTWPTEKASAPTTWCDGL
jgi:hypothetical protein